MGKSNNDSVDIEALKDARGRFIISNDRKRVVYTDTYGRYLLIYGYGIQVLKHKSESYKMYLDALIFYTDVDTDEIENRGDIVIAVDLVDKGKGTEEVFRVYGIPLGFYEVDREGPLTTDMGIYADANPRRFELDSGYSREGMAVKRITWNSA